MAGRRVFRGRGYSSDLMLVAMYTIVIICHHFSVHNSTSPVSVDANVDTNVAISKFSSRDQKLVEEKQELCQGDMMYVADVESHSANISWRNKSPDESIPRVLYQTSKSRCVTPKFYQLVRHWRPDRQNDGALWAYRFHDESSMLKFLGSQTDKFPLLKEVLLCVTKGTALADLWRYLIIYTYGGYYADMDSIPASAALRFLNQPGANALFLVDKYNLMSEYFFGASPGHPLLYYAIHHTIQRILIAQDTGSMYPGRTTGPHALLAAFHSYSDDVGVSIGAASDRPIRAGVYQGRHGYNVVILGSETKQDEFVIREAISPTEKEGEYAKMGMQFYLRQLEASNSSCLKEILNGVIS